MHIADKVNSTSRRNTCRSPLDARWPTRCNTYGQMTNNIMFVLIPWVLVVSAIVIRMVAHCIRFWRPRGPRVVAVAVIGIIRVMVAKAFDATKLKSQDDAAPATFPKATIARE